MLRLSLDSLRLWPSVQRLALQLAIWKSSYHTVLSPGTRESVHSASDPTAALLVSARS